jgi:hypothetical protein
VRRTWPILATLTAAIAVALGSAGLRVLHIATAPEHVGHSTSRGDEAHAASACAHSHGHSCGTTGSGARTGDAVPVQVAAGAADSADRTDAGTDHSHDSHDVDCATCDLLVTLSTDVALPAPELAPCGAAGDAPRDAALQPAVRTLVSVRARPPPAA